MLNLCFGFATARYVASRFKRHAAAVDAAATASLTNPNEDTDDESTDPAEPTQDEQSATAESDPDEDPPTLDAEAEPDDSASDEAVLEKASIE